MALEATDHIHPQAFYKGYKAFRTGKLDNPFRKGSLFAKEWQRGFNSAYFVNLKFIMTFKRNK